MAARKNAAKTPGKPFEKGNPGRPKGSRNKVTVAVETLLDGEAENLTRKAVELALAGDTTALRLCIDRIAPPRRTRKIAVDLPEIANLADVSEAMAAVIAQVATGEIAPDEGQALAVLLETQRKMITGGDFEDRLAALEKLIGAGK